MRGCRAICGEWSNIASVAVELSPGELPVLNAPAAAYNGNYRITWSASAGATTYTLEERAIGAAWVVVRNGADENMDLTGKAAGSYDYRVRACNPIGCTGYSAIATVNVSYPPTGVPGLNLPARVGPGSIGIGWNGIGGADRYTLQESSNGAGWVTLLDAHATSYATPARGTGTYSYRVAACNGAGCGGWSAAASVAVIPPPSVEPVINAPAVTNVPYINLSWSVPGNTDSFVLQESQNGGGWSTVQGGGASSFGADRGRGTYAYRVQACNFVGCSLFSAIATVVVSPPPSTPAFNTAIWLTTRKAPYRVECSVGWSSVSDATRYELDAGEGTPVMYNGTSSFISSGNSNYCRSTYRIRACSTGACSAWSAGYSVTRGVLSDD